MAKKALVVIEVFSSEMQTSNQYSVEQKDQAYTEILSARDGSRDR